MHSFPINNLTHTYLTIVLPFRQLHPIQQLHPPALSAPLFNKFFLFDNFSYFSYDNFIHYLPFRSVIQQKIKKNFNFYKIIVEILLYSCYNNFCRKTVLYFDRKDVTTHNIAKFNPPLFLNYSPLGVAISCYVTSFLFINDCTNPVC